MVNLNDVFGRINNSGTVDVLFRDTGEAVTRLDADAYVSNPNAEAEWSHCKNEHAKGIELTLDTARALGIEIE